MGNDAAACPLGGARVERVRLAETDEDDAAGGDARRRHQLEQVVLTALEPARADGAGDCAAHLSIHLRGARRQPATLEHADDQGAGARLSRGGEGDFHRTLIRWGGGREPGSAPIRPPSAIESFAETLPGA